MAKWGQMPNLKEEREPIALGIPIVVWDEYTEFEQSVHTAAMIWGMEVNSLRMQRGEQPVKYPNQKELYTAYWKDYFGG